jgi:cyclic beta-1,2-glucan synthetase
MGTGDWNDGMNRVGVEGKGESIWVAWFQIVCLHRFARLAELRQDAGTAKECRDRAEQLRHAIEAHGYDGNWYLRAYFDDGTPLGSSRNDECRIDSIVQSWAVISGVADKERAERAMNEVSRQLIEPERRLLLLFTPPFDAGPLQPGYIKGYLPGIRENGGQYTHAATWVVKALATLGRANDAHAAYSHINPILGTTSADAVGRYRGEPYVVAADVYSMPPHVGRAGWTWYTGSASWLYRVGLEDLLGLRREGNVLHLEPCIPAEWPEFELRYRFGKTEYQITVTNTPREAGPRIVTLDGVALPDGIIHLVDDGSAHTIRIGVAGNEPAVKPRSA